MPEPTDFSPWWLTWILPILALLGTISVLVRKLLTATIQQDFKAMLDEMHRQNTARLDKIEQRIDKSDQLREDMDEKLSGVAQDVAYLRGKASGTFKAIT